ncbi:MAG TPA: hypothetical protein VJM12_01335 [Pyrinomonadaceae bacterium]|nr:hypothetical protein [Pyrinomonadaceae bacterium]
MPQKPIGGRQLAIGNWQLAMFRNWKSAMFLIIMLGAPDYLSIPFKHPGDFKAKNFAPEVKDESKSTSD